MYTYLGVYYGGKAASSIKEDILREARVQLVSLEGSTLSGLIEEYPEHPAPPRWLERFAACLRLRDSEANLGEENAELATQEPLRALTPPRPLERLRGHGRQGYTVASARGLSTTTRTLALL